MRHREFLIMNNFIFLSFDSNYGDEFDVRGFVIISFSDWLDYKAALESYETPFELYFGTNESFKFTDGKDLLRRIKAVSISNSEKLTFEKTTGLSFGWFPIEIYDADGKSIW